MGNLVDHPLDFWGIFQNYGFIDLRKAQTVQYRPLLGGLPYVAFDKGYFDFRRHSFTPWKTLTTTQSDLFVP